jgi:hypothetical protein
MPRLRADTIILEHCMHFRKMKRVVEDIWRIHATAGTVRPLQNVFTDFGRRDS